MHMGGGGEGSLWSFFDIYPFSMIKRFVFGTRDSNPLHQVPVLQVKSMLPTPPVFTAVQINTTILLKRLKCEITNEIPNKCLDL